MPPTETTATLRAVRELHSTMESLLDAVADRYHINRNDLRCLEILQRDGPMSPRDLADTAGLSPAAVTKVTDRLTAAGYIERHPNPHDRRAHHLRTSGDHAETRDAAWHPVETAARALLDDYPAGTLREFMDLLRQLSEVNRQQAARLSGECDP